MDSSALLGSWRSTGSGCSTWSEAQYRVSPSFAGGVKIEPLANPACMAGHQPPRDFELGGALLRLDTMWLLEFVASRMHGMGGLGGHRDLEEFSTIGWARVLTTGDTLRLVTLDGLKVSRRLASRPGDGPHRMRGSAIILTGDSEQTAAFLLRAFADSTLVSTDTGEFVRVPP
jgi:hypothetical protein